MALNMASALTGKPADPQNTHLLQEVWSQVNAQSCPYHYNFHMHTTCSDGQLHPHRLMEQAVDVGLQGLAITDHHTVAGYLEAIQWLKEAHVSGLFAHLPVLWTGMEITARLLNTEVHILGYGFDPDHVALRPYTQGEAPKGDLAEARCVIDAFHKAGGLVVLAHPARYRCSTKKLIPAAVELGIDGVETYYAYRRVNPWQPNTIGTIQEIEEMSDRYGVFRTCGTDTHGSNICLR
ncbi:PHP domain-containing protein [Spirulina sp. CS-785/01]|uniref:PHP domain-containing protein n=1 Tax=Spirulina sp. CS-785/01 TaxID=3021716 RepID=UPI003FA7CA04